MKINFDIKDLCKVKGYETLKVGKSFTINGAANILKPRNNSIMFSKVITPEILHFLKNIKNSLIIASIEDKEKVLQVENNNFIIYVEKPRREYAIILSFILDNSEYCREYKTLDNCIVIGKNSIIGNNTRIEPCVFIDNDVVIGDNCTIMSGTRIKSNVKIGNNTVIRENSVIGGQGYGIERDEDGFTIRIPHLGGVVIGDNVEVGALTAVAQGTIEPTIISDFVKIDNLVHIAHNVKIGRGSMIIACAEVSGSTEIGENVWVAPNACIINKSKIGSYSTIGMGAVVIRDVPEGLTVTGNPAEPIEAVKKFNKIKKNLINNSDL